MIFGHGLGDCVHFCSQIPLYKRRGYDVNVFCPGNKRALFRASGARLLSSKTDLQRVGWEHCPGFLGKRISKASGGKQVPEFNKAGYNLSLDPMPSIGTPGELWDEYIKVSIPLTAHVGPRIWAKVNQYLEKMPRPIVLVHSTGTSFRRAKSLSRKLTNELFEELLNKGVGSIVCLDRVEAVDQSKLENIHYWQTSWAKNDIRPLIALQGLSDTLIGIDSGPFHLCRHTGLPSIGIFPTPGHHPAKYCLPGDQQVSVVPSHDLPWFHDQAKAMFPIVEEKQIDAPSIAKHARRLLAEPRYLTKIQKGWDLQIQHWIGDRITDPSNSCYDDLARIVRERFQSPRFVEVNQLLEGNSNKNTNLMSQILATLSRSSGGSHTPIENVSNFRARTNHPIDILSLGKMKTNPKQASEECLHKLRSAYPMLDRNSLIVINEQTNCVNGDPSWGQPTVSWLQKRGWYILSSNSETILSRV